MKTALKIFIFLAIIILVNCAIYIYPIHKVLSIYNTEQNNITMDKDINPNYGRMVNMVTSDIADEYKRDTILLFTDSRNIRDEQRNEFYKILVYGAAIISIIIAILGFIIRRKSVTNKYIGTAIITSSIVSILILSSFYYLIYMSLQ
jgi:hypothetical protein